MRISDLLRLEDILPALKSATKEEVLEELAAKAVEREPGLDRKNLLQILLERERLGSTGIGAGIAIPHGKLRGLVLPLLAFGRSREGIDFNALDGRKVYLFFLLAAPEGAAGVHLKMLARISRIFKDPTVRRGLLEAPDATAILTILHEQDNRF